MTENRVIPPQELYDLLCQDRQVISKNKQGFTDIKVKKRHDDVDFNKEIEQINNEYQNP